MAKSTQAQAAALIRKELKANGIKGSVRSSQASMMNAVDVTLINPLPATIKAVTEYANQYQYGSFNSMEDLYEYSNRRKDIPQVKYVSVDPDYTDDMYQAAWDHCRDFYADCADLPESYIEARDLRVGDEWVANRVHKTLRNEGPFWTNFKPRIAA